ncbi:activity regulator of membrane protease YbbK [Pseudoalteromonas agarivorans]|uniref:Activity regulator of membrane protease YbbK n=1 Tax=Pseudoalteromonas agarivorans TaxID=176102 RepID=A0AAD0U483_9GAMM|nr:MULTISPECIES: NfeD family protein [Pseudoalteromonas]AYM88472.1 NfeD family protein [Pseudoalteromonas agarivorans]KYL31223.1 activity regulator of membrane protease YbbK [Pseudoalteromonas telluritireducens]|tara:strand:+ start:53 stop:508 length:456 start_codon:yes stop_codon:yes gene_type:complete
MDLISQNLPQALMVIGIIALIIEVTVLGLSTIILLFLGLSLLTSGLLMVAGVLPETITAALWSNTIITAVLALLLWKPMKRMQENVDSKQINSDFADLTFVLAKDVSDKEITTHQYSGISWQLKSTQPISAGTKVVVVKKEVGVMWVAPAP